MAKRTASARKQARAGVRRALRNRAVRSEVKTRVVKARRSLSEGPSAQSEAMEHGMDAVSALDRAAAKGILHRNNAARRKARLMRQLAKLSVPALAMAGARKGAAPAAKAPAPAARKAAKPAAAAKETGKETGKKPAKK